MDIFNWLQLIISMFLLLVIMSPPFILFYLLHQIPDDWHDRFSDWLEQKYPKVYHIFVTLEMCIGSILLIVAVPVLITYLLSVFIGCFVLLLCIIFMIGFLWVPILIGFFTYIIGRA